MATTHRPDEPAQAESAEVRAKRLARQQVPIPEALTEGRVELQSTASSAVDALPAALDDGPERYAFTWVGKRDALRLLQAPSRATLVPCREQSVNFCHTRNLFLVGDNLEVLKLLLTPYLGRVKMIYIDPPYNTGDDLIYADDYADPLAAYLRFTAGQDAAGKLLSNPPEANGCSHSAWLSMIYPRLCLAQHLLCEDGVILVSIDDHEVHNLRLVMNEVLGEENFMASFVWRRRTGAQDARNNISTDHEYVLCYGRNRAALTGRQRTFEGYGNPDGDPRGPWVSDNLTVAKPGGNTSYAVQDPHTGIQYWPPRGRYWPYNPETMKVKIDEGRILFPRTPEGTPRIKRFQSEARSLFSPVSTWIVPRAEAVEQEEDPAVLTVASNTQGTREIRSLFGAKVFPYAKPVSLIKALVEQGTSPADDIVLDFFAGSCTTAQAVLELNRQDGDSRQFIMVQLPEPTPEGSVARIAGYPTIADLGQERIRRVIARMQERGKGRRGSRRARRAEDLGFQVFTLGPSNFQGTGTDEREERADARKNEIYAAPLIPGWNAEGVVYELMVKEGYQLACQVAAVDTPAGNTLYRVTDPAQARTLEVCLDGHLDPSILAHIAADRGHLFVCRETALADGLPEELAQRCRLKTIPAAPLPPSS